MVLSEVGGEPRHA